ncbi:MAG: RagB/SusD family nutrient uptake outer membrane protein [Bacteroidota bacterium]
MKYIILLIPLFIITSCSEDFLERTNPNEQSAAEYWQTEAQIMNGINAAYRPLRFNGCYGRWLHVLYTSRSDEGYSHSPNPTFVAYSNFQTGSYNNAAAEGIFFPWLDMYKGIFWANQVIDNAPDAEMDQDLRTRVTGEALFLRGVHYFNLAGTFGRGPIQTTSFAGGEDPPIGEQEELYMQAARDFLEAVSVLPAEYPDPNDLGRATEGAARGMLAKVYMQLRDWESALEQIEAVVNMKGLSGQTLYALVSDYKDNFTAANENNSESVFEVQFAYGTLSGIQLGQQRAKFLGLQVDGCAWADADPRRSLYNDFLLEKTTSGQTDPRLKQTLFYFDPAAPGELSYGKSWDTWGLNHGAIFWKKYTNYGTQTGEDYNSGINIRVVRLADIYLMYAEVLNELGRTAESYEYINRVRSRSGIPDLENSTVFTGIGTDPAKMHKQIQHERLMEMAGENTRWFDLERWGMFENQADINWLAQRDQEFSNFEIGTHNRFPIPYREIPLVPGLNQNPGY